MHKQPSLIQDVLLLQCYFFPVDFKKDASLEWSTKDYFRQTIIFIPYNTAMVGFFPQLVNKEKVFCTSALTGKLMQHDEKWVFWSLHKKEEIEAEGKVEHLW